MARVAIDLAKKFGGFAAEDELDDDAYVEDLSQIILSVAPSSGVDGSLSTEFTESGDEGRGIHGSDARHLQ